MGDSDLWASWHRGDECTYVQWAGGDRGLWDDSNSPTAQELCKSHWLIRDQRAEAPAAVQVSLSRFNEANGPAIV